MTATDHKEAAYVHQRSIVGSASAQDGHSPAPDGAASNTTFTDAHRPLRLGGSAARFSSPLGACLDPKPRARQAWVNTRRITHGVGAAMVAVNEVGSEGQPNPGSNLPPTSAPERDDRSGPFWGSTSASVELVRGGRGAAGRIRLPHRRERHRRIDRDADALDGDDGDQATTLDAAALRGAVFRDLKLYQRPASRAVQSFFHRSLSDRLSMIEPLRFEKDPTSSSTTPAGWLRPGRVTTSEPCSPDFPNARPSTSPR